MSAGGWYVHTTPIPVNTETEGFTTYGQQFVTMAASWNTMTFTSTNAAIGGPVGSDLSGSITGVGLLTTFTGNGGVLSFDNFLVNALLSNRVREVECLDWRQGVEAKLAIGSLGLASGNQRRQSGGHQRLVLVSGIRQCYQSFGAHEHQWRCFLSAEISMKRTNGKTEESASTPYEKFGATADDPQQYFARYTNRAAIGTYGDSTYTSMDPTLYSNLELLVAPAAGIR